MCAVLVCTTYIPNTPCCTCCCALQVSSGATDDLRQATNMARHMVMQCGLNDAVGPVFIEDGDMKGLSEGLRQQVDEGECLDLA